MTHEDKIVKRNAVMAVGSISTDGKMFFKIDDLHKLFSPCTVNIVKTMHTVL